MSNKIADSVLDLIGGTPLVRLRRLPEASGARVLAKIEARNPGASVKDRIAAAMVEDAERRGVLKPGATIVEPTSGNTGVGLAMVAAVKGYRLILTMPEDYSVERQRLFARFGAEIHLTPAIEGMSGAVFAAQELCREHPDYFMPQQFQNPANPEIHRRTTALEILEATEGRLDAFVAGVGTGGTITGVGEVLKSKLPGVLVVAVEPAKSPVLSGGPFRPHGYRRLVRPGRPQSQRDRSHRDRARRGRGGVVAAAQPRGRPPGRDLVGRGRVGGVPGGGRAHAGPDRGDHPAGHGRALSESRVSRARSFAW